MPTPRPAPRPTARLLSPELPFVLASLAAVSEGSGVTALAFGKLGLRLASTVDVTETAAVEDDEVATLSTSLTGSSVKYRSEFSSQSQLSGPQQQNAPSPHVFTPEWLTVSLFVTTALAIGNVVAPLLDISLVILP